MGLDRARRLGHRPGRFLPGSPAAADTVRRKIGLELELAVPIDKAGSLSKDDEKILAGTKRDTTRLAEIRGSADAGYGEFYNPSGKGWAFHADHSSRVLPEDPDRFPIRVLGRSILEIVFDPPVETPEEVDETFKQIGTALKTIDAGTGGLKKRKDLLGGISVGPIDGDTKPAQLGYDAAIQVNLGVDVRQFAQLVEWYAESEYAPKREHFTTSFTEATEIAELVTEHLISGSGLELDDVQSFNGLRGLTALFILYLKSGQNEAELRSSVKNFTAILLKTPFSQIVEHGLTPAEFKFLNEHWEAYKKVLLFAVAEELEETDVLIKRTKPGKDVKTYKDPSWKIRHLFKTGGPPLVSKAIDATEVGPDRSPSDKVTGGGRRKAPVFEFRSLPGPYEPSQWKSLAKDFLAKADELNAVKDYAEPKKKPRPEKDEGKESSKEVVDQRIREVESRPLPPVPVRSREISVEKPVESSSRVRVGETQEVIQKGVLWYEGQTVTWSDASWQVMERRSVSKFLLKRVA